MIGNVTLSLWTVEIAFSEASVVITDAEYAKQMKLALESAFSPFQASDGDVRKWARDAGIDLIQRLDNSGNLIVRLSDGRSLVVKPSPCLGDLSLEEWTRNLLRPGKPN